MSKNNIEILEIEEERQNRINEARIDRLVCLAGATVITGGIFTTAGLTVHNFIKSSGNTAFYTAMLCLPWTAFLGIIDYFMIKGAVQDTKTINELKEEQGPSLTLKKKN